MTRDPRMQTAPAGADPLGMLSGVPAWLKQRGDELGGAVAGAVQSGVPGVEGALTGLSWLDDTFLKTPVGAAALGADALTGGELGRSLDRTGTPWWERPKEAAHRTFGAFQEVAEDPNAPLWSRAAATVPRVLNLRGEMLAPIAPGSGAIRGAVTGARAGGAAGAVKGAAQTVAKEALQPGRPFSAKTGEAMPARDFLTEFAKDYAVIGRPEARAIRAIADTVRDFRERKAVVEPSLLLENVPPNVKRITAVRDTKGNVEYIDRQTGQKVTASGEPLAAESRGLTTEEIAADPFSGPEPPNPFEADVATDLWTKGMRGRLGDGSQVTIVELLGNGRTAYVIRDGKKTREMVPLSALTPTGARGAPGTGRVAERKSSAALDQDIENDPELWELFNSPRPEEEVALMFSDMVKRDAQTQVSEALAQAGAKAVIVLDNGRSVRAGAIDPDLRFTGPSGHLLNTGEGPVPLLRVSEIKTGDGKVLTSAREGALIPLKRLFAETGGSATVETAINIATGGLLSLIKKWLAWRAARRKVVVPPSGPEVAPGVTAVEPAVRGSREVDVQESPTAHVGREPEPLPLTATPREPIITRRTETHVTKSGGISGGERVLVSGRGAEPGDVSELDYTRTPYGTDEVSPPGQLAELRGDIVAPEVGEQNLGKKIARAMESQNRRLQTLTHRLAENEYVSGTDAEDIVATLKRLADDPDNTITHADVTKVEKLLEPVITAQRFHDSVKDINDQVKALAERALRVASEERSKAVRDALGIQRKIADEGTRAISDEARSAQRIARIDQNYNQRVQRINAATEKALNTLAQGESKAIMEALEDLDMALADAVNGPSSGVPRKVLSNAEAEKLAREGYLSQPDRELLDRYGFNTGKYHPIVARRIAEAIRDNSAEWDRMHSDPYTRADALSGAARWVGVSSDELLQEAARRGLTEVGNLTSFMVGLRLGVIDQIKKMKTLKATGASDADLLEAHTNFQRYLLHVGGASSEVARALSEQKQVITKRIAESFGERGFAAQVRRKIVDAEAAYDKAALRVAEIQARYEGRVNSLVDRNGRQLSAASDAAAQALKKELDKAKKQADLHRDTLDTLRATETKAIERAKASIADYWDASLNAKLADADSIDSLKAILELGQENIDQIVGVVRNLKKVSRGDKLVAYYSNNAFSSIVSQEANALSPFLRIGSHIIESKIAEEVGKVYTALTGRGAAIDPGESGAFLRGLRDAATMKGSGETIGQKWAALNNSDDVPNFVGAMAAPPKALEVFIDTMLKGRSTAISGYTDLMQTTAWKGKAGVVLEFWLRTNGAFDAFGKHMMNIAEQNALYHKFARRQLLAQGLEVTPDTLANRIAHLMADPTDDLVSHAADISKRLAEKTAYASKFSDSVEKVLSGITVKVPLGSYLGPTAVGKFIFMASRFTWAATIYGLESSTPLGLIKAANRLRQSRAAGAVGDVVAQEEMAREAARMGARGAVGSAAAMWATQAYVAGLLIGKDPEGRGRDDSVKIGDNYISLRPFWPVSAPLILTAHSMDRLKESDAEGKEGIEKIANLALGWGEALANQPVMRSTYQLMQALKYGGDSATRFAASHTARFLPSSSFMRDVAAMIDKFDRDPRGDLVNAWKENIPFLSVYVEPRVNTWGEPVVNKPEGLARAFPFASHEQDTNPAQIEIARLSQVIDPVTKKPILSGLSAPERRVNNVELAADQHALWQQMAGEARKQVLIDLVQSAAYKGMDPKEQAKAIRVEADKATERAKRAFAVELMKRPDAESQLKGVRIGIGATTGNYQRVKMVQQVLPILDANLDMARSFDEMRQGDDLTLDQYRQAAQLLPLVETQPEFSYFSGAPIGSEEQWSQYHDELRHYNQLLKDGRKHEARIWLIRHPVLRRYRALAQRPGGKNAVVTRLRERYPVLRYIALPSDEGKEDPLVRDPVPDTRLRRSA